MQGGILFQFKYQIMQSDKELDCKAPQVVTINKRQKVEQTKLQTSIPRKLGLLVMSHVFPVGRREHKFSPYFYSRFTQWHNL